MSPVIASWSLPQASLSYITNVNFLRFAILDLETGMKGADDQTIAATRPSVRLSV